MIMFITMCKREILPMQVINPTYVLLDLYMWSSFLKFSYSFLCFYPTIFITLNIIKILKEITEIWRVRKGKGRVNLYKSNNQLKLFVKIIVTCGSFFNF